MAIPANHAQCVAIGPHAVRYAEGGVRGARRTLLLFNGIGASVETAAALLAGFERTRVIAFDVPGVGGSPAPLLPYRMDEVASLAAGLLDHLGIARADVLGVSWGGAAAQEFAIRHPRRCRTLTLAATCAGLVMVPGQPGALLAWLRLQRDVLAMQAGGARRPSLRGALYQLLAVCGWTSWHRLHRVDAPTLVLMGTDDPVVPPINGRIVASRLRRARLESVEGGHHFVLRRPGETARRIERFMAEHPAH